MLLELLRQTAIRSKFELLINSHSNGITYLTKPSLIYADLVVSLVFDLFPNANWLGSTLSGFHQLRLAQ